MQRAAVAIEIGWRGSDREALRARADRHGDHVLLQPFVVADTGVAAGGEKIDEAFLRHHLQPDVGIGFEKGRHDRGQHQPGDADRHVELQRARRPVTEGVDDVERGFDLGQRRRQPFQQAPAGLGRHDGAGRAVEQPHSELRFQPAYRIAQRRRAAAAPACGVAKAAGSRHRDESIQVGKIRIHCPDFRTTCSDCAFLSNASASAICRPSAEGGIHDQH